MKAHMKKLFPSFELQEIQTPLFDFGGHKSEIPFYELYPTSLSELCQIIATAYDNNIPIRIRGNGHSMNASSLPKRNELLVRTDKLNYFNINSRNTIKVGAGATVWDLHTTLLQRGYGLKIYNGLGSAATIGGYISAGGVANSCLDTMYGGLWNTVEEITLIGNRGDILNVTREDPLFPWIFGSMGQLGIIGEVKLNILEIKRHLSPYLFNGLVEKTESVDFQFCPFNLFGPQEKIPDALNQLEALEKKYPNEWQVVSYMEAPFPFNKFNPPLLYPFQKPFVGLALWGVPKKGKMFTKTFLNKLYLEFQVITDSDPSFRRYIQTEWTPKTMDYRKYFGKQTYQKFLKIKNEMDPQSLINKDAVFKL